MSFEATIAADRSVRRTLRIDGRPDSVRLAVSPGGCSGLSSEISIVSAPGRDDFAVDYNGIRFFMTAGSRIPLHGATIDFVDNATQTSLVFHRPREAASGVKAEAVQ